MDIIKNQKEKKSKMSQSQQSNIYCQQTGKILVRTTPIEQGSYRDIYQNIYDQSVITKCHVGILKLYEEKKRQYEAKLVLETILESQRNDESIPYLELGKIDKDIEGQLKTLWIQIANNNMRILKMKEVIIRKIIEVRNKTGEDMKYFEINTDLDDDKDFFELDKEGENYSCLTIEGNDLVFSDETRILHSSVSIDYATQRDESFPDSDDEEGELEGELEDESDDIDE